MVLVRDSLGGPVLCQCKLDEMFAAVRRGDMAPPVFRPVPAAFRVSYTEAAQALGGV